jgi:subtilase family serine protease
MSSRLPPNRRGGLQDCPAGGYPERRFWKAHSRGDYGQRMPPEVGVTISFRGAVTGNHGQTWRGDIAVAAALVVVPLLASACTSSTRRAPVSLPVPKAGEVTFYVSLPSSTAGLGEAGVKVAIPGSPDYRHFSSLDEAARQFGATDAQIDAVAKSVRTLGLQFAADPTRLFGRVTGSTKQWQAALGTGLSKQPATASSPFITYTLPRRTPAALEPSGTRVLLAETQVYDPTAEGSRPPTGSRPTPSPSATSATATRVLEPWPFNTGIPLVADCSAPVLQQRRVYTPSQVQTAYGIETLRSRASATPVITVLDLGGGWLPSDLELAGQCFGYSPPNATQTQGDGVAAAIANADDETSMDLQTAAAVAPGARLRLVQSTRVGLLDGFSRAVGDLRGLPDVISLSYGGCALAENRAAPGYTAVINAVLAMTALTGVSTFVAAGDHGSTTCGSSVPGTTLSYPAVSPFVTAVGGTRLTLGAGNTRVSETVWNDSAFGLKGAGGGGLTRLQRRPEYQDGANARPHRAVPDVSALADTVPGWPVVISSTLQTIGGTSGSAPFVAAATALVAAAERKAGRPPVGLANGWFYRAASQPSAFFDVTQGNNDLAGVGCCQATVGYDLASGLGVPNWATLAATLPKPG